MKGALVLVAVIASTACKRPNDDDGETKPRRARPRATVHHDAKAVGKLENREGVFLVEPTANAEPVALSFDRKGKLGGVHATRDGSTLVAVITSSPNSELVAMHLEGDKLVTGEVIDADFNGVVLDAATDGSSVLAERAVGTGSTSHTTVVLHRVGKPANIVASLRALSGASLSSDGSRALVSGVPDSCTDTWIGTCPMHILKIDTADGSSTELVSPRRAAAYQARFSPKDPDAIWYQSTEASMDDGCKDINHCRHDLYRTTWSGRGSPELMRKNAYGLTMAGRYVGFLTFDGSSCTSLPCSDATYYFGDSIEDAKPLAHGVRLAASRFVSTDMEMVILPGKDAGKNGASIYSFDGKKLVFVEGWIAAGWLRPR